MRVLSAVLLVGLAAHPAAGDSSSVRQLGRGHVEWAEHPVPASAAPTPEPVGGDPDLEPGFPVQCFHTSGSYHSGSAIHVLVANLDADLELELVKTALAAGPLYAWNHDGSPVAGWPATAASSAAYPVWGRARPLGPLSKLRAAVFSAHSNATLMLWRANAAPWSPGWPRTAANYVATPPTAADLDGDGGDELLLEEENWALHAYNGDGSIPAGWPVQQFLSGQERHTPAIANLDGVGAPEVLTVGGTSNGDAHLFGYHADGSVVSGFPVLVSSAYVDTFPVVGDVDGDGDEEIVVVRRNASTAQVLVFSKSGALERTLPTSGDVFYGTAPALADLNGDGFPEIVVQTNSTLEVLLGTGGNLAGWPQTLGAGLWLGNSGPVVGDVTGDGQPDIAVTTQVAGSSENGHLRLYHKTGAVVSGFPKTLLLGSGATPAIADIDLDGRNELIAGGSFWNGVTGSYDTLWAYDLHGASYGPVLWGQFMGGPRHQGRYGQPQD